MFTATLLEQRGYTRHPDGSWSKPDDFVQTARSGHREIAAEDSHARYSRPLPEYKAANKTRESAPSCLASKFQDLWCLLNGPTLTTEHRFHKTRRWRFDYAHLPSMTAIEIDGGTFSNGRHNRAKGYIGDCAKINAATALGWKVYRLATGMVKADAVQQIIETIYEAKGHGVRGDPATGPWSFPA